MKKKKNNTRNERILKYKIMLVFTMFLGTFILAILDKNTGEYSSVVISIILNMSNFIK
jgi:hypothetical protein